MSDNGQSAANASHPQTLAIDVGGTRIKALVLDPVGKPTSERAVHDTPKPAPPEPVLSIIAELASGQPEFHRVAVGFPGVVRAGVTMTAPNLDPSWHGFNLAGAIEDRLARPVRVANDADTQGFGAIAGQGVELVLTLGTGLGSALFVDGILVPNLELAHHPFHKDKTYEDLLGKVALKRSGRKRWRKHLDKAIEQVRAAFNFDTLYLGGGNSAKLDPAGLPEDVRIVSNIAGLLGGIALWHAVPGTNLVRAPHAPGCLPMQAAGA
jgi:polyphosphate glucokinase